MKSNQPLDPLLGKDFFKLPPQQESPDQKKVDDLYLEEKARHTKTKVGSWNAELKVYLPVSDTTLRSFLITNEGKAFTTTFEKLIEELGDWSTKNGISADSLKALEKIKHYLKPLTNEYESSEERLFRFYQQGALYLHTLLQHLENNSLDIDQKKTVVEELLKKMATRGPEVYSNIITAACSLAPDLKTELMDFRRSIAHEILSQGRFKVSKGERVGYENKVLNAAKGLGLPQIEDESAEDITLNDEKFLAMQRYLQTEIPKHLTIDRLLLKIINDLHLDELTKRLLEKPDDLLAIQTLLENKLARYGSDENFDLKKLFVVDKDSQVTKLKATAAKEIEHTLFNRLKKIENFIIPPITQKLTSDVELHSYPGRSLNLSTVTVKANDIETTHSALSYFTGLFWSGSFDPKVFNEPFKNAAQKKELFLSILAASDDFNPEPLEDSRFLEIEKLLTDLPLSLTTFTAEELDFFLKKCTDKQARIILGHTDSDSDDPYLMQTLSRLLGDAAASGHTRLVQFLQEKEGIALNNSLLYATQAGHIQIVKMLLEKGAEPTASDLSNNQPLHCAVQKGQSEIVTLLLANKASLHAQNKKGETPLFCAVQVGNKEMIKALLNSKAEAKATLEIADNEGNTPLLWAIKNNHPNRAKLLIREGASLEAADKEGNTPLLWAIKNGDLAMAGHLIEKGASLETADKEGNTPFLAAIQGGHIALVELLAQKKELIDQKNTINGRTPLICASDMMSEKIVKILIKQGANLEIPDNKHNTPLMRVAGRYDSGPVVKLLLDAGANIPRTALELAKNNANVTTMLNEAEKTRETKRSDFIKTLAQKFINNEPLEKALADNLHPPQTQLTKDEQESVLSQLPALLKPIGKNALSDNQLGFIKELFKSLDTKEDCKRHFTPDFITTLLDKCNKNQKHDQDVVDLIAQKLSLASTSLDKAFFAAARGGHTEILKLLLQAGADPNQKNEEGHKASQETKNTELKELLKAAENDTVHFRELAAKFLRETSAPSPQSISGSESQNMDTIFERLETKQGKDRLNPALIHALLENCRKNEQKEKLATLFKEKIILPMGIPQPQDKMALLRTAKQGYTELVRQLLDKKVPIDFQDKEGKTALHWAVKNGQTAVIQLLLEKNASPDIKDKNGKTPLATATQNQCPVEITSLLIKAQGNKILAQMGYFLTEFDSYPAEKEKIGANLKKYKTDFEEFGVLPSQSDLDNTLDLIEALQDKSKEMSGQKNSNLYIACTGLGLFILAAKAAHSYIKDKKVTLFFQSPLQKKLASFHTQVSQLKEVAPSTRKPT